MTAWVKEGSDCEDDTFTEAFARYRHHFYDPNSGDGFGGILWTNSELVSGRPAPDWAIDLGPAEGQWYSYRQARQYFLDGLTRPDEPERKASLARMFRGLGDVIHLVQDMAQPQHTRNDGHGFPKSVYEVYTDLYRSSKSFDGGAIPLFATAREYLTDLAWFSNHDFVSAGTNFQLLGGQAVPGVGYSEPSPGERKDMDVRDLSPTVPSDVSAWCAENGTCVMSFYSTSQTVQNDYASALSVFDQYVGDPSISLRPLTYPNPETGISYRTDRVFGLNRYTFDAAHSFLLSRAVSYSAGLLDHFFRGGLAFGFDPGDSSKYLLRNTGTEEMRGTVAVYYDSADGRRHPVMGADGAALAWTTADWADGGTLAAGAAMRVPVFSPPTSPMPAVPGTYLLAFSGDLGQEKDTAVVAKLDACQVNAQASSYPEPAFSGTDAYESMPVAWLTRDADGQLFLDGYVWIKKDPIPPPQSRCFPSPLYGCIWYTYYPPSPYANNFDPAGDRFTPGLVSSDEFVRVWLDLNGDGNFSPDELVLDKRYSPYLVDATWYSWQLIKLHEPISAHPGAACQMGMRYAVRWGEPPAGPEADFAYGSMTTDLVRIR